MHRNDSSQHSAGAEIFQWMMLQRSHNSFTWLETNHVPLMDSLPSFEALKLTPS
jgi:hypothetical protein